MTTAAQDGDQVDSNDQSSAAIQKIKEEKEIDRFTDSLRLEILREELGRSDKTSLEELEKYKKEISAIRKSDSLRYATRTAKIDSLRQITAPAYVQLYSDTLFSIYGSLGPFDATTRAKSASDILHKIYKNNFFYQDSVLIDKNLTHIDVRYKDVIITSISEDDAIWANQDIDSLAIQYQREIIDSIHKVRAEHNLENVVIRWLKVLGILILFYLVYKFITLLFNRLISYFIRRNKRFSKGVMIRNYELINPRVLKRQFIQIIRITRIIVLLFVVYITLSLIFSVFPNTQNWAYTLWGLIYDPLVDIGNGFIAFIPNLIKIVIIFFIARFASRLLRFFSYEIQRNILKIRGFHKDWAEPTYRILKFFIYVFAFVLIFPLLPGANTAEFKGVSVFLGVLFSLGSTSAISNTIAGIIITYMRPFKVGDWIKVNNVIGEVIEKTALVTRLRTINNEDVTVPNSSILTNHTINYSSCAPEHNLCISTNINIRYGVRWEKVEELLLQAAYATMDITHDTKAYVFQLELKENYVIYQLNAFTKLPHKMYFIKSELNQNIQSVFRANGIEIVSPIHVQMDGQN